MVKDKKKKKKFPFDCYGVDINKEGLFRGKISYPQDDKPIMKELGELGKW